MIRVDFPPALLSGHNNGHPRRKAPVIKRWRRDAFMLTKAAKLRAVGDGDIHLRVTFVPADRRGDRTNFSNRMKPIYDGMADAMGVNDRRFVPQYVYAEPAKPGHVMIEVLG